VGPAYVPILLLIAGLLALAAFLPGTERSRLAVAAVSVGGAAGAIVSLGTPGSFELFANPNQVSSGLGAILLVIFGIIQAVIAVGAYVVGADTLWKPKRGNGPSGAPPPAPNPVGWDATGSAGGPGPIDPSLVGRFTPERPRDVGGHPGPGAAPWPTDRVDVAQGWAGRGTSSGYPPAPTGMSPSWPAHPEEPETGPQMVVGLETGRVDTRKVAAVESTARDGAPPTAAATSVGDVVELAGEPADAAGSRDGDPGYPRDTAEPEPAHRQES
jgi:hypothetical protein